MLVKFYSLNFVDRWSTNNENLTKANADLSSSIVVQRINTVQNFEGLHLDNF